MAKWQSPDNSIVSDETNNLGCGTPGDREDRIRQRAHELWEQEVQPDGQADRHWERATQDVDCADTVSRASRNGNADGLSSTTDQSLPKSDRS